MKNEKLMLSEECKVLKKENRVIIVNTYTGYWYKLSNECYEILMSAIKEGLTKDELISCIFNNDDKIYFNKLLDELNKIGIINSKNYDFYKISQIFFNITHRCNLQCIHCAVSASSINEPEYLTTEQIQLVTRKIKSLNPREIIISGGEPLVRKDFWDIMDYIKKDYDGTLVLMTNGLMITEDNVDKLMYYFNDFSISIDGVDELSCSKVRGKGVFEKVINSVKILKQHGVEYITLSAVLDTHNKELRNKFKELNEELGTKPIFRYFSPVGRGRTNEKVIEDIIDNNKYYDNFEDKEKNSTKVNKDNKQLKLIGYNCNAIRNQINIDSDGTIYPCAASQQKEFSLGNILEIEDVKKYFKEKEYFTTEGYKNFFNIIPYNNDKCKDCDINLFCVRCPFRVYTYNINGNFNEYCKWKKEKCLNIWLED